MAENNRTLFSHSSQSQKFKMWRCGQCHAPFAGSRGKSVPYLFPHLVAASISLVCGHITPIFKSLSDPSSQDLLVQTNVCLRISLCLSLMRLLSWHLQPIWIIHDNPPPHLKTLSLSTHATIHFSKFNIYKFQGLGPDIFGRGAFSAITAMFYFLSWMAGDSTHRPMAVYHEILLSVHVSYIRHWPWPWTSRGRRDLQEIEEQL